MPRSAFLWVPLDDTWALHTWAHTVSTGTITAEGMRFAVWVRMAPTTHTSRVRGFHYAYYSAPASARGTICCATVWSPCQRCSWGSVRWHAPSHMRHEG